MNTNLLNYTFDGIHSSTPSSHRELIEQDVSPLFSYLLESIKEELSNQLPNNISSLHNVSLRIAQEVERVCAKSDRIQQSGAMENWALSLARHRIGKCLSYFNMGSKQGRVELHSSLSVMIYRYISPAHAQLSFTGKYNLIEDFLQDFYAESLKAFRRENLVAENYQPRTRLELAEYMAFTEHYAKRRINLPTGHSQQLIILRAQTFSRRQPNEAVVDIEQALEYPKEDENQGRTAIMQQLRSTLISDSQDPNEVVIRDRLLNALFDYLETEGHQDCANYLALKLQDFTAQEIDQILNLSPRQRDYLQQRFKYHVEKFSRTTHWQLVHQWLGADLDQQLGLTPQQWQKFLAQLTPQQRDILALQQEKKSTEEISKSLRLTPKKVQKQWTTLLELAWTIRNEDTRK